MIARLQHLKVNIIASNAVTRSPGAVCANDNLFKVVATLQPFFARAHAKVRYTTMTKATAQFVLPEFSETRIVHSEILPQSRSLMATI